MFVRDLRPREMQAIVLKCSICGRAYSANADDYTGTVQTIGVVNGVHIVKESKPLFPADMTPSCCGTPLDRVLRKKKILVEYEPA